MFSAFSHKLKKGNAALLVVGVVIVLGIVLGLVFGPKIQNFGQLSLRQEGQESKAAGPAADDADVDGFSDSVEKYVGTDPKLNCGNNAWPPDINNDKLVNQADLDLVKPHWQSKIGDKNYNKRVDLNADKRINSLDYSPILRFFDSACPYYFIEASAKTQSVTITVKPSMQEDRHVYFADMTESGKTDCNQSTFNSPPAYKDPYENLKIGSSSFTWGANSGSPPPRPGHKYCAAIAGWQYTKSNFVTFTMGLYNLSVNATSQNFTFNWSPGLESENQLWFGPLDPTYQNCPEASSSGYAGQLNPSYFGNYQHRSGSLASGTSTYTENVGTDHQGTWCAVLVGSYPSDAPLITSKIIQFTYTAPTATPTSYTTPYATPAYGTPYATPYTTPATP